MISIIDLDPVLVAEQIEKRCAEYETIRVRKVAEAEAWTLEYEACVANGTVGRKFIRRPTSVEQENDFYKKRIAQEREVYSRVRIVELTLPLEKKFVLVYGKSPTDTEGTGPFESVEKASNWFFRGGR